MKIGMKIGWFANLLLNIIIIMADQKNLCLHPLYPINKGISRNEGKEFEYRVD
jgi:hypothetical protein